MARSFEQSLATSDEIRLGFASLRAGIAELQKLQGIPTEFFVPFRLLSDGYERLLKILLCLSHLSTTGAYPDVRTVRNFGHDLRKLLDQVCDIAARYPLYSQASARVADLAFLRTDADFQLLIGVLSEFARLSRYYNLDLITGAVMKYENPETILIEFRREYWMRHHGDELPLDFAEFYSHSNRRWTELLQRAARAICFFFTQGAFGPEARQYSAGLLSPFLLLRDHELATAPTTPPTPSASTTDPAP